MLACVFPGQGSQAKGMGAGLFPRFPRLVARADEILGYSLEELCLRDAADRLTDTSYAQPALFAVSALSYLARDDGQAPAFLAGHSLGEYAALFAAGCFDFDTGLRLVQKRGELMARANGGAMLAVLGAPIAQVQELLRGADLATIDVANVNAATQVVLSGPAHAIDAAAAEIERRLHARCIPLRVSAPFHSRYMASAAAEFDAFLQGVLVGEPRIPVIANVTAEPYGAGDLRELLVQQIRRPVRWWETMRYLRARGVTEVEELGPGSVLKGLWKTSARESAAPALPGVSRRTDTPDRAPIDAQVEAQVDSHVETQPEVPLGRRVAAATVPSSSSARPAAGRHGPVNGFDRGGAGSRIVPGRILPERLGSEAFRRDYGCRYAYVAGAMYCGIASTQLVLRAARAGFMGFFGAGGLDLDTIEDAIRLLRAELGPDGRYGMNLLHAFDDPQREEATVALYLRHGVRFAEAAGYVQITPPLVHFRYSGCHRGPDGHPVAARRVIAKVSRPEVAAAFMRPPADATLRALVAQGRLTSAEADLAARLPISDDICVESDSGGHTDGGVALALFPSICRLRDESMARYAFHTPIRVGAAGGLGTPAAVAAAFTLGADFVLTGSINQCSPEAGTSSAVKDILAGVDVQDTAYAPAGDMFGLGAKVQVIRKGTLFPGRANKLEQIYNQCESLDRIDPRTRDILERTYFKRSFEDVWSETCAHLARERVDRIDEAERNPKRKMALVFKWYFARTGRAAIDGIPEERVNYQIHCGPAMGAFNQFVKGTDLEDWRNRHVDVIAHRLMEGAAAVLSHTLNAAVSRDSTSAASMTSRG